METRGEFTIEGAAEMVRMMDFIKDFDSRWKDGSIHMWADG